MGNTLRILLLCLLSSGSWADSAVLEHYKNAASEPFSAPRGEALWKQLNKASDGSQRSCATCHGEDLSKAGKHATTGKKIEAMALSANKGRYTELKKVEKWFTRNCKWTFERECTAQEKGDFLAYLTSI